MEPIDNIRLVEQCKSGDRDAFGLLYQTYLPSMREVVGYYIHNHEIICDILHDGFLIALRSIGSLKDNARVESWLTTIMKNLSLQYLKSESEHQSVSISEVAVNEDMPDDDECPLTFGELDAIISKLPDGYATVFRLSVLEGLSHKEIGALLGIAPHSSSSQLSHAKSALRRMIRKYRAGIGILALVGAIILLRNIILKSRNEGQTTPILAKNVDDIPSYRHDSTVVDKENNLKQSISKKKVLPLKPMLIADVVDVTPNSEITPAVAKDSVPDDTLWIIPRIPDSEDLASLENITPTLSPTETSNWALSLAYSGNQGQTDFNHYMIPDPSLPDSEGPDEEIEVSEKSRHYMPLVIGLSLEKSLSPAWSVETGLRYTFLRSDFLSESSVMNRETNQRIHYLGVPLNLVYRMLTYNGLSFYVKGGGAVDIPVNGNQHIREQNSGAVCSDSYSVKIHAPLQWSAEAGFGLQYRLCQSISIYAEPSLRYYFRTESDIRTIRQDRPFEFSIPIGLRWSW